MRLGTFLTALLGASTVLSADEPVRYSDAPLQQKPLQTAAEVAAGTARFYNPPDDRKLFLNEDRKAAQSQQAYLLIDSILKRQREEGRTELDESDRKALRILLDRSTLFGVYGAGLVARQFGSEGTDDVAEPLLPPKPFELRLEFPQFVVSSAPGHWRVEFPWYFMFTNARHFVARNGLETDVLGVSTSFAGQENPPGQSQAGILFIHSFAQDCSAFDPFWLGILGMTDAEKSDEPPLPAAAHYTLFDSGKNYRKEVTFASRDDGCVAFAYLGVTGPFVANRVSYLDFIRSFSDFGPTVPAGSIPKASFEPCPPGQTRYESNCYADPVPVKKVMPEYPGAALMAGVEGQVTVQASIAADGSVTSAVAEHCTRPGYGFEKFAVKAVKKWRYNPSTVNGWPRNLPLTVVITFEIQRKVKTPRKAPPPYDAETLESKRKKVLALVSASWCRDDSQCASVAIGSKPCGGPRENRVYSAGSVDPRRLLEVVADYNAYEAGWNEQQQLASDCSVAPEVQPACVDHKCIDRNLAPDRK